MTRVKSIASRGHRALLKSVKGYKQARRTRIQTAMEARLHAGQYAFAGRKLRKRDLRALWIIRLNAAVRPLKLNYSKFVSLLVKNKVELDRKILSDIAATDLPTFIKIVDELK